MGANTWRADRRVGPRFRRGRAVSWSVVRLAHIAENRKDFLPANEANSREFLVGTPRRRGPQTSERGSRRNLQEIVWARLHSLREWGRPKQKLRKRACQIFAFFLPIPACWNHPCPSELSVVSSFPTAPRPWVAENFFIRADSRGFAGKNNVGGDAPRSLRGKGRRGRRRSRGRFLFGKRCAKHHLVITGVGVNVVGECHDISSTSSGSAGGFGEK